MAKRHQLATAAGGLLGLFLITTDALAWNNCASDYQRLLPPCCPSPCPVQDQRHRSNQDRRQTQEEQRTEQNQQQSQTTQRQQQATGPAGSATSGGIGAGSPLDSLSTAGQFVPPPTLQGLYFGPPEATQSMTIGGERPSRFTDAAKNSSDAVIEAHVFVFRAKRQIESDAREIAEMAQQLQSNPNLRTDHAFANRVRAKVAQVLELRNALQARLVEIKSKRRMFHLIDDQTPDSANRQSAGSGSSGGTIGAPSGGYEYVRPNNPNSGTRPIETATTNPTSPPPRDPDAYQVANGATPTMPNGSTVNPPNPNPISPGQTPSTTNNTPTQPTTPGTTPTTPQTPSADQSASQPSGSSSQTPSATPAPANQQALTQMTNALQGKSADPQKTATAIANDYGSLTGGHADRLRQIALRASSNSNPYGTTAENAVSAAGFLRTQSN